MPTVALCIFALAPSAAAQVSLSPTGIEFSVSIENPTPGQIVTVTARSYSADLSGSSIVWYVNGVEVKRGIGVTSLETVAPDLGKTSRISVSATTAEGKRFSNSTSISSGSVDLVVETDGYVPPFFKGKIPPMYQNVVKIVAIPRLADATGKEYDPKTLVYTWQRNDRVIEDQSGYGRQAVLIEGTAVPRPYTVTVDVQSRDGNARAQSLVQITPVTPFLGLYVDDPLYGALYNKAVDAFTSVGSRQELGITAVPFGFNHVDPAGGISYEWKVNGASQDSLISARSVTFRAPDGSNGISDVDLSIRNSTDILQGARGGFRISFTAPDTSADDTTSGFRF